MILWSVFPVFAETLESLQARYLASIATPEGLAYEALVRDELWRDLGFLPRCIDRFGVDTGAVTVYYAVDTAGRVIELHLRPDAELAECIRRHIMPRTVTPPPHPWIGRVVLTIGR